MKIFSALIVASSLANTQIARAKPFGALSSQAVMNVPRGGDLGPLTSDTAAKALVGLNALNGWSLWQAPEGFLKAWGVEGATEETKIITVMIGAIQFVLAAAGFALLKGCSAGTTLGVTNLLYAGVNLSGYIDDAAPKINLPKAGLVSNLVLASIGSYANLCNQDWAPQFNKVYAAWYALNALGGILFRAKMDEVWGDSSDGTAAGDVLKNNLTWFLAAGAVLACCLSYLDEGAKKIITYSNVPVAVLCAYNAFVSEPAKELFEDGGRYGYLAVMLVLMAALLL